MDDVLSRIAEDLVARVSGPMKFRLILQPAVAVFFAVRGGLRDARANRPPYFWALFTDPASRRDMLKDGWKSVGRVIVLAVVMDAIYQFIVARKFYPVEALLVAVLLAIVPYILVRGPVNRVMRRGRKGTV